MNSKIIKLGLLSLSGIAIAALFVVNVFASVGSNYEVKAYKAFADAKNCYTETVTCTKSGGGSGTKTVCDVTATGIACSCGDASTCH